MISEQRTNICMLGGATISRKLHSALFIWGLEKVLYIPEGPDAQLPSDSAVEATEIASLNHYVNIPGCEQ